VALGWLLLPAAVILTGERTSTLARSSWQRPTRSRASASQGPRCPRAGGVQTASFIVSAAFVLLRLTGHLDEEDRQLAVAALDFQVQMLHDRGPADGGPPRVLLTQRDDLVSWRNPT
jgi:hypothetical protein